MTTAIAPARATCPNCGGIVEPSSAFCGHCGSVWTQNGSRVGRGVFLAPARWPKSCKRRAVAARQITIERTDRITRLLEGVHATVDDVAHCIGRYYGIAYGHLRMMERDGLIERVEGASPVRFRNRQEPEQRAAISELAVKP